MTFVYPVAAYGCETWAVGAYEKTVLDRWWMSLMRRIYGVTVRDKVRSEVILANLGASMLSKLVDERQLRYHGHVQRYPDERWAKFITSAARPGQTLTGKRKQWIKQTSTRLQKLNLTTDMMKDKNKWNSKLDELFAKRGKAKAGKIGQNSQA